MYKNDHVKNILRQVLVEMDFINYRHYRRINIQNNKNSNI